MSKEEAPALGKDRLSELLQRKGPRQRTSTRPAVSAAEGDAIVQSTDGDAAQSRLSAVRAGYLEDEFASLFTANEEQTQIRLPIINRGTYVRTTAIDKLVRAFLGGEVVGSSRKQIVSLGAGSDTRYFRLAKAGLCESLVYHELDFPVVARRKVSVISKSLLLNGVIARDHSVDLVRLDIESGSLQSPSYNIHPLDLRQLTPSLSRTDRATNESQVENPKPVSLVNVDSTLDTLIISECCLIYLLPEQADNVVKFFSTYVFPPTSPLTFVIYEPIRGDDAFGKVMTQNLAARGIVLRTLQKYATLEAQKLRLRLLGLSGDQEAMQINQLWNEWISQTEKERISKLEMLDEVEEWELLAAHYCVAWGSRGPTITPRIEDG